MRERLLKVSDNDEKNTELNLASLFMQTHQEILHLILSPLVLPKPWQMGTEEHASNSSPQENSPWKENLRIWGQFGYCEFAMSET